MYQRHESTANLPLEQTAAILSNCVSFFNTDEQTQAEADSSLIISKLESDGRDLAFRLRHRSTILFSSPLIAREAAYILRGEWDRLNAVILHQADAAAIKTTVKLLELELGQKIEFCHNWEFCYLKQYSQIYCDLDGKPRATTRMGKSALLTESLIQSIVIDGGASFIKAVRENNQQAPEQLK